MVNLVYQQGGRLENNLLLIYFPKNFKLNDYKPIKI